MPMSEKKRSGVTLHNTLKLSVRRAFILRETGLKSSKPVSLYSWTGQNKNCTVMGMFFSSYTEFLKGQFTPEIKSV